MLHKQFKVSEKIPSSSLYLFAVIGLPVAVFFLFKNIIVAAAVFVLLLFVYFRTGKIKPKDGEVIFIFGLPGSGKTSLMAKIAVDNINKKNIVVNNMLSHLTAHNGVIQRDDIGKYRFGSQERSCIIMFDEVSLDGFDNRDYKTNFAGEKGEANLAGFKKCRHRYQSFVLSNQGYDEVDKKVRSGLVDCVYWVKNKGSYSVAVKLRKDFAIDNLTGEPRDEYKQPSFFDRLIDPSCYIYIKHKRYGKYFDTHFDDDLPYYFNNVPQAAAGGTISSVEASVAANNVINNLLDEGDKK